MSASGRPFLDMAIVLAAALAALGITAAWRRMMRRTAARAFLDAMDRQDRIRASLRAHPVGTGYDGTPDARQPPAAQALINAVCELDRLGRTGPGIPQDLADWPRP